jgi:hypothetical protein
VRSAAVWLALGAVLPVLVFAGAHAAAAPPASRSPLLGVSGNAARFKAQTGQTSAVQQAFIGWGQGSSWGSPFDVLFRSLGPIPMIHIGTLAKRSQRPAITVEAIAAGAGDAYLGDLNRAISTWGRAIYIRPLAEMNNPHSPWATAPATYRKAFARIFVIIHGGPQVPARLARLHLPPYRGPALEPNAFPRVRVVWSPLSGGNDPAPYWPGSAYVDVGGADIYREAGSSPPWQKFQALLAFVRAHHRPFAVPEWGTFGVDDAVFVQQMCAFLRKERPETEEFYNGQSGSEFDLGNKPASRSAYRRCVTRLAGPLPSWATGVGGPGVAPTLSLVTRGAGTSSPARVSFAVTARPATGIVHWEVAYGDGVTQAGSGAPPPVLAHVYAKSGSYEPVLIAFPSPPFTDSSIRYFASTYVQVGSGPAPLTITASAQQRGASTKVVFRITSQLGRPATSWQIIYGDGLAGSRPGAPPGFAGHTYTTPGRYRILLVVTESGGAKVFATADVTTA